MKTESPALTHAVAALLPKIPQTQHALFTAGAVPIRRTTLTQLLQEKTQTCISKAQTARDSLQKHWIVLAAVLIIMLLVVQAYLLHISNFFH